MILWQIKLEIYLRQESLTVVLFSDPRKQAAVAYELHLCSKLLKVVSRYQEKCGKSINSDYFLLVKSCGKRYWTDKTSGGQQQRFGSLYIHFKDECLKTYIHQYYAPDELFNYKKVKVDSKTWPELSDTNKGFMRSLGIMGN